MVGTLIMTMVWGAFSSSLDTFEKVRELVVFVPLSLLIFASALLATSLKAFRIKKTLGKLLV